MSHQFFTEENLEYISEGQAFYTGNQDTILLMHVSRNDVLKLIEK